MSPAYRVEIDPAHPERALESEWLLTNGLGGYAMGTALGVNTRRYHGLLTAALQPPVDRHVVLHSTIEQLVITRPGCSDRVIELSTQQFAGDDGTPLLHPGGFRTQRRMQVRPPGLVEWSHEVEDVGEIIRGVSMWHGINGCEIGYDWKNLKSSAVLRVRPLFALRNSHQVNDCAPGPAVQHLAQATGWRIACGHVAAELELRCPGRVVDDTQCWERFFYARDAERGQRAIESLWSPGVLEFDLSTPRGPACFFVTLESSTHAGQGAAAESVSGRSTAYTASRQFVVHRGARGADRPPTIIAGYPWFTDWGRDAMIAMPGLLLCNRQFGEAEHMLLSFAQHMRNGLIPNRFDDHTAAAEYNTVDASLWFVYAVFQLCRAVDESKGKSPHPTSHLGGKRELLDACSAIVAAYCKGTDYHIFMDDDGLIAAGDPTTQLTWMDAKRNGVVFTPRHGKAVEINALWFNALHCLAAMTNDRAERDDLLALARRVGESFRSQFWWVERHCLHDVLMPVKSGSGGQCPPYAPDGKLRPNQIFAVSLPHSPLDLVQQRAVLDVVTEKFLTPFGLRTLDRSDPDYRPLYEGDMMQRDAAYHNGTVWPWLIGPYCDALLRVHESSDAARQTCLDVTQPLVDSMQSGCLGQIAEIYDGDPPHRPDGCPAQAWSVAEVLRIRTLAGGVL